MVDIYGIKIHKEINKIAFNNLLPLVAPEKKDRIKKFKFFNDAQRCLLGDLLARYVICNKLGIKNSQLKFSNNKYGKPVLLQPEGINFNISHSGDWIVCALDNKPVGIDVEIIKPIDFNIAKMFFTEVEYNDLMTKDDNERLRYFYTLWTLKESYIKAVGKGLSISLNSFAIHIEYDNIWMNINKEFSSYFFKLYKIDKDHVVAVCSQNKEYSPKIKIVNLYQLLDLDNEHE
jgi:4'-phosphopantetheinyl transferase